jgi:hypothetical protein
MNNVLSVPEEGTITIKVEYNSGKEKKIRWTK